MKRVPLEVVFPDFFGLVASIPVVTLISGEWIGMTWRSSYGVAGSLNAFIVLGIGVFFFF